VSAVGGGSEPGGYLPPDTPPHRWRTSNPVENRDITHLALPERGTILYRDCLPAMISLAAFTGGIVTWPFRLDRIEEARGADEGRASVVAPRLLLRRGGDR